MKPIRLIELFAGIGSQAKALKNINADFETYRVVEFDKYAIKSYNAVHGTDFETSDITEITGADLGIVDTDKYNYILTYSFPCQDLSVAGLQAGMDKGSETRSGLLWEVERLLNECDELPQVLLMENVTQVHGKKNKDNFNKWCEYLENRGYKNFWQDLNAKNYGVPQNRNRCFMISILTDVKYVFPQPIVIKKTYKDILEKIPQKKYTLTDYQISQIKNTKYAIDRHKENTFKLTNNLYPYDCIMDYRYDEGLRIRENNFLPTLTTKGNSISGAPLIYNKKNIRFITPLEEWRGMGFDDADFYNAEKVNNNTQLYKQAGNSIVVDVLEKIFENLLPILE